MSSRPLSPRQLRWIIITTSIGIVYKLISQLSPFYLLPSIPSLPSPHRCAVRAPNLHNCTFTSFPPPSSDLLLSCASGLYHFAPSLPETQPTLLSTISSSSISLSPSSSHLFTVSTDAVHIYHITLSPKPSLSHIQTQISLPGVHSITAGASDTEFYVTTTPSNGVLDLVTGRAVHVSFYPFTMTPIAHIPSARGLAFNKRTGTLHVASHGRGVYDYHVSSLPAMVTAFHRTAGLLAGELVLSEGQGLFASMKADGKGSFVVRLLSGKAKHQDLANAGLRLSEWQWKTAFVDDGSFYTGKARMAGIVGGRFIVAGQESGVVVCEGGVPVIDEVEMEADATVKDEL